MKHQTSVLIVDSKEISQVISSVVTSLSATAHVKHVDNAEAALTAVRSGKRFDLVFFDWKLGGERFLDNLRIDARDTLTPVIVLFELDTDEVIASAIRHGATDFMVKPFLKKGLIQKVNRVMNMQQLRRQRRLQPDHTVFIHLDLEHGESLQAEIHDLSLAACCARVDFALRNRVVVGEAGVLHLNIEQHKISLRCRVTRTAVDLAAASENIIVLFSFDEAQERESESLAELLDEYAARW